MLSWFRYKDTVGFIFKLTERVGDRTGLTDRSNSRAGISPTGSCMTLAGLKDE
jgi:hypothetical protein